MPCNSGNSPTMSVTRSHFESDAARITGCGSMPSFSAMIFDSSSTRLDLSPMLPSLSWKMMSSSSDCLLSSDLDLSVSQKNMASDNRGTITRSFPLRTCSLSLLSILLIAIKQGSSLSVFLSRRAKYRCCFSRTDINNSCGKPRNASSKSPRRPTGHSTRAAFSLTRLDSGSEFNAIPLTSSASSRTRVLIYCCNSCSYVSFSQTIAFFSLSRYSLAEFNRMAPG